MITTKTQKETILAMLRARPQTNGALGRVSYRYGARIMELRRAGYAIESRMINSFYRVWLYTLTE